MFTFLKTPPREVFKMEKKSGKIHTWKGGGTKFVKCVLDGRPEMQRKFFPKFVTPPFSGHTL